MIGETILYIVLPYAAIVTFIVGIAWRYRTDQYGWSARSTQLLEGKVLGFGSIIFHLGVLAAIGGHVLGVLIPKAFTDALGLSQSAYHVLAVVGGISAGGAVIVGFSILMWRRFRYSRVRVTTTNMDLAVFALLAFGIVTGMLATLTNIGDSVHYRESVSPYFRKIFIFQPEPALMTGGGVTLIFQLHVIGAWLLLALWPFSRLVHAFSIPIDYLRRSHIPYRSHTPRPARGSRPVHPTRSGSTSDEAPGPVRVPR